MTIFKLLILTGILIWSLVQLLAVHGWRQLTFALVALAACLLMIRAIRRRHKTPLTANGGDSPGNRKLSKQEITTVVLIDDVIDPPPGI